MACSAGKAGASAVLADMPLAAALHDAAGKLQTGPACSSTACTRQLHGGIKANAHSRQRHNHVSDTEGGAKGEHGGVGADGGTQRRRHRFRVSKVRALLFSPQRAGFRYALALNLTITSCLNQDGVVNAIGFFVWIGVSEKAHRTRGWRGRDADSERDGMGADRAVQRGAPFGGLPLSIEVCKRSST